MTQRQTLTSAALERNLTGADEWRRERARAELRASGEMTALKALARLATRPRRRYPRYVRGLLDGLAIVLIPLVTQLPVWFWALPVALLGASGLLILAGLLPSLRRLRALEGLAVEAERVQCSEAAPLLLEVLAQLRTDPELAIVPPKLRVALLAPLPRLLSRLTADEAKALTEDQRTMLWKAVAARTAWAVPDTAWDHYSMEFSVAALVVLASAGDARVASDADWIARNNADERLRAAADEYTRGWTGTR